MSAPNSWSDAMNMSQLLTRFPVITSSSAAARRPRTFAALAGKLIACIKGCADRYAAECAYQDLSRLSDAELKHRGLSRDVRARDLTD